MKKLLEYIVKSIVDKEKEVKVEEEEENPGEIILKLSVAQEDMGKVIGRGGKIIKAIRTIVRILAIKNSQKVTIELEDKLPKTQEKDYPSPSGQNPIPH